MTRAWHSFKRTVVSRSGAGAIVQTLITNVFILGVNFGTGVLTARLLEPAGRGELTAITVWPQFLSGFLALGLPGAIVFNLKRHPDRASQLSFAALLLGAVMGAISVVVGVLWIPHWLTQYPPRTIRFAQLCMLIAPAMLITLILTRAVMARDKFALYNALRFMMPTLTLIMLIVLALVNLLTPFSAALSYLLSTIPIFFWNLVAVWRLYRPRWHDLFSSVKDLTSYGLRSYGGEIAQTLNNRIDRVLVVGLLSPAATGLYVVALSLSLTLQVCSQAVVQVLFSKASGRSVEEVLSLTGRATRATIAITVLGVVGLEALGPWLLNVLYGQEFLDAIRALRILVLAVALSGIVEVLARAFMAVNRPGWVTVMQSVGAGLSVPLVLVLAPRYGPEGAALALLISATVRLVFMGLSFPWILKVRVPRLWLTRADVAAIAAALVPRTTEDRESK